MSRRSRTSRHNSKDYALSIQSSSSSSAAAAAVSSDYRCHCHHSFSISLWRLILGLLPITQPRILSFALLLFLLVSSCQDHIEAFSQHQRQRQSLTRMLSSPTKAETSTFVTRISTTTTLSSHERNILDHQHTTIGLSNGYISSRRRQQQSRTQLYEKSKGKSVSGSDNKSNNQKQQQQQQQSSSAESSSSPSFSFLPSFFSSSSEGRNVEENSNSDDRISKEQNEEDKSGGGWRAFFFRRNKSTEKDESNEEISKRGVKQSKSLSSSTINTPKTQKLKKKQEPVIIKPTSVKLRQQAKEQSKTDNKKKQTQQPAPATIKTWKRGGGQGGTSSDSNKNDDKNKEEEEASLWGKVTTFWRNKGNAMEESKDDDGDGTKNTTNPISVVQKYWQDAMNRRDEEWIDVIPKTRLSPGDVVPVTVGGLDLLIIAGLTSDTRLYAIANSCPHLGTPLEIGQLVRLPKEGPTPTASDVSVVTTKEEESANRWTELQVSSLLQQDGCEDCIVCPLHRTAFALESGQVRGEWCPYPPVVGKLTSLVKEPTPVATFDVRVRKKNIQVRLNSPLPPETKEKTK